MKSNKPSDELPVKASLDAERACASASDAEEEGLPGLPKEKPVIDAAELLPVHPRDDPPGWPDL